MRSAARVAFGLGWIIAASAFGTASAAAGAPSAGATEALRIDAEVGIGYESSSSPLLRVTPDGALVALDGLSRRSGQVAQASVNASGDWPLAGPFRLGATGLTEQRRADRDHELDVGLGLVDLAVRWPLAGGMAGFGSSYLAFSVAGRSFRRANALHLDWSRGDADESQLSLRVEVARYRHAAGFGELDAEVAAPSGTWRWAVGAWGLSSAELGMGWRRERNRRGFAELSHRSAHLSMALGLDALSAHWTATVTLQRSRFDSGLFDGDVARRDCFTALDLSAEWGLGASARLVAGLGLANNRARPNLYDDRHRQASLSLAGSW